MIEFLRDTPNLRSQIKNKIFIKWDFYFMIFFFILFYFLKIYFIKLESGWSLNIFYILI